MPPWSWGRCLFLLQRRPLLGVRARSKTVPGSHLVLPPSVHISPQEKGELIVEQSKSHPESDPYVIGM